MLAAELMPCDQPSTVVPTLVFAAWGVVLTARFIRSVRDREAAVRRMAERRANSRLLRWMGESQDPEGQFRQLWKGRWGFVVALAAYWLCVATGAAIAVKCR